MKTSHPSVYFTTFTLLRSTTEHKHPGMLLDVKLSYQNQLYFVLNKVKKTIDLLHRFE